MFVTAGRADVMRSIASPSTQIIDTATLRGLLSP
jgi:hypothetical protein